jgi:hypothetical protein
MVAAVVEDTPEDWSLAVVMDWSGGFWEKTAGTEALWRLIFRSLQRLSFRKRLGAERLKGRLLSTGDEGAAMGKNILT